MILFDQLNKGDRPLRVLAWGVLGGMFLLTFGLWRVQVLSRARYQESVRNQSFRTVRVPAMRGRILDRFGRALADNQPRYRLEVYLDELRPQFEEEYQALRRGLLTLRGQNPQNRPGLFVRIVARFRHQRPLALVSRDEIDQLKRTARFHVTSNVVAQVSARFGVQLTLNELWLYKHWSEKRALPMTILDHLTPSQIALITEQSWSIPGVELELQPLRNYPHGALAAHLVGHLRRDEDYDEEERRFDYRLQDFRGAVGLEGAFDSDLRGTPGAKAILVNSAGYRHRQGEKILADAQPGKTLVTTLDLDLQKVAEHALSAVGPETRGAVVVMDLRNGDVLAIGSAPSFEPGQFLDGISREEFGRLYDERLRPALNRATSGSYAPGSIFKIVTSLAVLDGGMVFDSRYIVQADPERPGRGHYQLGRRSIGDTVAPGEYDFLRAFIKSSNTYFIDHAQRLGLRKVLDTGHRFHLGEKTGLKTGEESAGFFPEYDDIKNQWTQGNLANVSIGQEITVTPLQMAVLVSAVANGGKIFWPRVVDRLEPSLSSSFEPPLTVKSGQIRSEMGIAARHFEMVRDAMREDVSNREGSGHEALVEGFAVCGKTGTAEVKQGKTLIDKITWFASFAPFESPRYTVIVMVESGGSGGKTCAPVARRIFQFLRDRERGAARAEVAWNGGVP
ncbi:MAG: hypothetical protein EXS36_17970 [Pedosphaera sp.]|nr:hypothetical protein [Pedosphaera sp.]